MAIVSIGAYPFPLLSISSHGFYNQSSIDFQSVMVGRMQNININVSAYPSATIYVTIMNYAGTPQSYTIDYQEMSVCPPCQNGGSPIIPLGPFQSICQCENCNIGFQGNLCDIISYDLASANKTTINFTSPTYIAINIPSSNSIKTYYQMSQGGSGGSLDVYIQFKLFQSEEAGTFNYAADGKFSLNQTQQNNSVDINAKGASIVLGVYKKGTSPVSLTVWYEDAPTSNVLAIVLGVLGGILFIALVVAACYIARRVRRNSSLVNPNSLQVGDPGSENKLSDSEVELFFPTVLYKDVFSSKTEETSSMSLKNNSNSEKEKETMDSDCVICLCPVGSDELMKGTYCRHMFHAPCLINWFKKQRNCPYCREDFSRDNCNKLYEELLLGKPSSERLKGVELVRAIFKSKPAHQHSKVQIEDLSA